MKNKEYERQYEKYADDIKSMQDNLIAHHKQIDDASADMKRKSEEFLEEREKSESTLKDISDKLQESLKLSLTNIEYNEGIRLFNNK